jgi:hypothetical protein
MRHLRRIASNTIMINVITLAGNTVSRVNKLIIGEIPSA